MDTISSTWGAMISTGTYGAEALTGNDYARYTPTAATSLGSSTPAAGVTRPSSARTAMLFVKDFPIRVRISSSANNPTATEGLVIPANTSLVLENQPNVIENFRFIDTAAGASEVTVLWFT